LGYRSKSLDACERDGPDFVENCLAFAREVSGADPARVVVIDERGVTTAMTRSRGRALRGVRVHGAVSSGHWEVKSVIGAIRGGGESGGGYGHRRLDKDCEPAVYHEEVVVALHLLD
jgi:hypothetical protein